MVSFSRVEKVDSRGWRDEVESAEEGGDEIEVDAKRRPNPFSTLSSSSFLSSDYEFVYTVLVSPGNPLLSFITASVGRDVY